jgi:peroxiredoxin
LYVDRNDDGKYNLEDERYDLAFPFVIDGRILELSHVAADGSRLVLKTVAQGTAQVTERPVKFAIGQRAPEFEAKLMDDKTVKFPGNYKGKIVLLTFWATSCGPCRWMIADEARAYERFKDEGFDVLGVSLDPISRAESVRTFSTDWGMTWPQILAGDGFDGNVPRLYDVQSMPHAILVDGTTGKVLAMPETLKQDGVGTTIRRVLAIREALREV